MAQKFYGLQLEAYVQEVIDSVKAVTAINPECLEVLEVYEYGVVLPGLAPASLPEDTGCQALSAGCVGDENSGLYLSDFSCRRIGCARLALEIASRSAPGARQTPFSPADWAIRAAQQCVVDHRPDLAERCLLVAIDTLSPED